MDKNLLRAQLLIEAADLLDDDYEELDESNSLDKYINAHLKKYEEIEKLRQRGKAKDMLRPGGGNKEYDKADYIQARVPYSKKELLSGLDHSNDFRRKIFKHDISTDNDWHKNDMNNIYARIQARTKNPISGYKYPESKHGHLASDVGKSSFKHGKYTDPDDRWM